MGSKRKPRRGWARCSDQRLLEQRFRDLDLRIERTWLQSCVNRLYQELENRGILFRPHVWLSTEWFSPDGIPGIAVPFYLAHPRLMRLERRKMLQVEGGTDAASASIARLESRFDGHGGIILIDRDGHIGHAHNTPRMALAGRQEGEEPFSSV